MASVKSRFEGVLAGYDSYIKDEVKSHTFYVLIMQEIDEQTKLPHRAELASIFVKGDNPMADHMCYGVAVACMGELCVGKGGSSYIRYSDITPLNPLKTKKEDKAQ